jgi:hypothetical protein
MRRVARISLICAYELCHKPFEVFPSQKTGIKYCSYPCAMLARPRLSLAEKFWPKVAIAGPDDCWLWTGGLLGGGYGSMSKITPERKQTIGAHIVSWFLHTGAWPDKGMFVLHSCDRPACVNPRHLWLGTQFDNMQDCARKGRAGYITHPERLARGVRHGRHTKPEHTARGERNGAYTHPESLLRGDKHPNSKVTEAQVYEAVALYGTRQWTYEQLGLRYGVTKQAIRFRIQRHKQS